MTYRFFVTPPNERSRQVEITAATLAEATQRVSALWMHQAHEPKLIEARP